MANKRKILGFIALVLLFCGIASGYMDYTTLVPYQDNTLDIGTSGLRWKDLYLSNNAYVAGNIGVGTTDPNERLHIYGSGIQRFELESSNTGSAMFKATNTSGSYSWYTNSNLWIAYDYSKSVNRIVLDGDGNVGIGPDLTPDANLAVQGSFIAGDGTNEFLVDGTGSTSFTGSARIDWTKIDANGVTKTTGTSANTVSDLQTLDGTHYVLTEVSGNPGMDLRVDYADVTAFNWVRILATYQGNSAHKVMVQLEKSPFDGSAWDSLNTCDHHATSGIEDYSFFIPDDSIYINSGVVIVRFNHNVNGSPGHTLDIDECSLYQ